MLGWGKLGGRQAGTAPQPPEAGLLSPSRGYSLAPGTAQPPPPQTKIPHRVKTLPNTTWSTGTRDGRAAKKVPRPAWGRHCRLLRPITSHCNSPLPPAVPPPPDTHLLTRRTGRVGTWCGLHSVTLVPAGRCGPKQKGPREKKATVKEKRIGGGGSGCRGPKNLALS